MICIVVVMNETTQCSKGAVTADFVAVNNMQIFFVFTFSHSHFSNDFSK